MASTNPSCSGAVDEDIYLPQGRCLAIDDQREKHTCDGTHFVTQFFSLSDTACTGTVLDSMREPYCFDGVKHTCGITAPATMVRVFTNAGCTGAYSEETEPLDICQRKPNQRSLKYTCANNGTSRTIQETEYNTTDCSGTPVFTMFTAGGLSAGSCQVVTRDGEREYYTLAEGCGVTYTAYVPPLSASKAMVRASFSAMFVAALISVRGFQLMGLL